MRFHVTFLLFFKLVLLKLSYSERLQEQIYSIIEGSAPCFRRLNGTHQMGCSSSDKGTVGVVHIITEVNEANWLTQNASAGPYVAVVSTHLFHSVIDIFINHWENIAGVLVFHNSTLGVSAFSQDSKCPNEYSSAPGSTCSSTKSDSIVWNDRGTDLIRKDIPFPIFFLPESQDEEYKKIEECYYKYNMDKNNQKGRPLCSVQLNSFMYAAVNSIVCLRRSASSALLTSAKVCDPLGDNNVYYSLFPQVKVTEKKPVILVTARIDATSLFDGLSPGTSSSAVGMVTLISAASVLAKMVTPLESKSYNFNVLWTLFNGESFDYIGSQKVAYDLSRGQWPPTAPLSPTDIPLHLEIGQIGGALLSHKDNDSWPLNVFAPVNSNNLDKISEIVNDLTSNINEYNMTLMLTPTNNLPPSSLHSFRRILKNVTESGALTELVIVDHNEQFTNMFYNSALDQYNRIGFQYHNITIGNDGTFISTDDLIANGTMKRTEPQVKIALLATAIARTLYKKVVGQPYVGNMSASAHLVDEMLYCFLKSQACQLLIAADYAQNGGGEENLPEKPAPLDVGVSTWASTAPVFAGHLLALLTGTHLSVNKTNCEAIDNVNYSYYWLKGWNHTGVCIQTTMNFSQAISPAFTIQDYDFTSGEYSTWTESVWRSIRARVFVTASGGGARAAVISGAIATILAAFLTYWLQRNASRIFIDAPTSLVANDAATGILRTVNC